VAELTEEQREAHVCCMKRRLCKEDHYHERDVVRLLAEQREQIAREIERELVCCPDDQINPRHHICRWGIAAMRIAREVPNDH
jgi:hypothetical protein